MEIFGGRERRKKREGEKGGKGGGEKGGDPGKKHRIFLIFEGAQERSTRYFGILGGEGGREKLWNLRAAEGRRKKTSMLDTISSSFQSVLDAFHDTHTVNVRDSVVENAYLHLCIPPTIRRIWSPR